MNDKYTGKFTFCSHIGQSTVDYLLMNFTDFNTLSYFDILEFNEHSDHAPVSFHLLLKPKNAEHNQEIKTESITRKIVWDKSKVEHFKLQLQNKQDSFNQLITEHTDSINNTVHSFTRLLHDIAFDTFGKTFQTKASHIEHTKTHNEWFDIDCNTARRDFNTARNNFNRVKNDEARRNFTRARTRYNKVKKKAKQKVKIQEGQRISKLAKRDTRKFWKSLRKTFKKKQDEADSLTVHDLHEHFKSVFGESGENGDDNINPNTYNTNERMTENHVEGELNAEFTESELRKAVFKQKDNKSPGIDSISSEILKASYDTISPFLLSLYNRMFMTAEYPRSWGEGIIAPIFKKGDVNDAGNYRGITLINIMAKIYSQLLLNRLTEWADIHDKITHNQFGFQKGKSIADCIFILHSVISKVLGSGQKLYCVFIDYEKCFDKINRLFLWQKLITENVSCKLVKAIKSMYLTVKSCVRYKSFFSEFFSSSIGLKQGDPSSPLLFMLFVNDIIENINSDLEDIFTLNEIKLFLILYADDQVAFAKSPETLQKILTDIENYCNMWGLKINTQKTKAMIFEKGRRTHHDFYIYNTALEVVESFKYLGMTLFKNGNWNRSQKCIAKHASFALYNVFTILNSAELPISQQCSLFDTLVGSILNFGSEIWGFHEATDIELIHTKFLRRILGVKKSTNLAALYGVPMSITRKLNIIKYWIKILNQNNTSLVKQVYIMLKEDANNQLHYNGNNWAYQIKNMLQQHGLGYVWEEQSVTEIPFLAVKQRITDNYLQKWYAEINNSSRLQSYSIYKHNFELEPYLSIIHDKKFKVALSRFRTSSHSLRIETGRYENIHRDQRLCQSCNMNMTETEFHFLLVCPHYRELRTKYLKQYYCRWPSIRKFEELLSSTSKGTICKLAKYIYFANKVRIS